MNIKNNKKSDMVLRKLFIFQVSIAIVLLLITLPPVRGEEDPLKEDFTFVGGSSNDEEVLAMEFITDEIVYLAGDMGNDTHPAGFFLMKLNVSKLRAGNPNYDWSFFWQRTDAMSSFGDMIIDSSGNIYIVGTLHTNGKDIFLMRFNSVGTLEWNITWGTSGLECTKGIPGPIDYSHPFGKCLVLDSANNVYIVGKSETDVVLIKYNNLGIYQWNQTWDIYNQGGLDVEGYCIDIEIDSNGNIYLALAVEISYSFDECQVIKCNSDGFIQWNTTFFYTSYYYQAPLKLLLDTDGLFYCSDRHLMKFDLNSGEILLNKPLYHYTIFSAIPIKMDHDPQGNLIILGGTDPSETVKDAQLLSFTTDMTVQANYSYSSYRMPVDFCNDNDDSTFILFDWNYIQKINPDGIFQYQFDWGYAGDISSKIYIDPSDNIYVSGSTTAFGFGDYNIFFTALSLSKKSLSQGIPFDVSCVILIGMFTGIIILIINKKKLNKH